MLILEILSFDAPSLNLADRLPCDCRLLDLKQDKNKEGQTILYLVFEYMDTDLKKYIRSFRQNHEQIPPETVKVTTPTDRDANPTWTC